MWVAGRFGKGLRWDEANGNVSTPGPFPQITNTFSLQVWVKIEKMPTGNPPFWTADVVGRLGSFIITVRPPGNMYVGVQLGELPNHLMGATPIKEGEWTHLTLTYDGPAGKIGLFVNEKLDTEFDLPYGAPLKVNDSGNNFFVRSYGGGDEKLVGVLDEVLLTKKAETFGHRWKSTVVLHLLRYQKAFLMGGGTSAAARTEFVSYELRVQDEEGKQVLQRTATPAQVAEGVLVPAPALTPGGYAATITARRRDGTTETVLQRRLRFIPPDKRLLDLTDQNVCLA